MWTELVQHALVVALIGLLCWAAVSDALTFTIPNRIPAAMLVLYPAWVAAAWPAVDPLSGLAVGAGIFALGFAAFARGWLGGGDVKLLIALGVWAGTARIVETMIVIVMAGGLLALAMLAVLTFRRLPFTMRGKSIQATASLTRQRIPYGVAIALGGLHLAHRLIVE